MSQPIPEQPSDFDRYYNGLLYSVMRWDQLTAFWQKIDAGAGWYLYAVGQDVPQAPSAAEGSCGTCWPTA